MAEPVISVLLEQLASAVVGEGKQQVRLVTGVEKDVAKLTNNLQAIQAVLLDAEKRQVREDSVTLWLDRLKDVSYEIDEVLDEWNSAILKSKIEKEENEGETKDIVPKKVCFCIPSSWFRLIQFPRVGLRHDIACKIKDLNVTLNDISTEKDRYTFSTTNAIEYERPKTTSLVDVSKVYGRENEKSILINKLLCESSRNSTVPNIIPIVGMGGIGKTTLAQLVYNDDRIKAHFEYRIWVCVSDPFDEIKIAKAILEDLKVGAQHLIELEALLKRILETLEGKRYLLILDDVWTEDDMKWDKINNSLKSGVIGSRVLVTTRKKEVAIMMGAESQMITLDFLSESVSWLIFSQLAFSDGNKSDELEQIGKQIALKCKGLPLVAKTLGSLMRFKKSRKQWEDILHSELWELENVHVKVFVPFLLSYYDLPFVEKRCFSFCSIFPKDYKIVVHTLIQLWMSQGYFNQNKNPENRGQDCYENLAMRSFFQEFGKDEEGSIIECKMHDIMHDFALFLTKKECSTTELPGDEEGIMEQVNEKTYHSRLVLESTSTRIPDSICNKKHLRTMLVMPSQYDYSGYLRLDFLSRLTSLRTLHLSRCNLNVIPDEIGNLMHLRYLNISYNDEIQKLPDTLCNLCNLQTLDMEYVRGIRKLPRGMGRLVNLRHLSIASELPTSMLPKGIGRLTSLRTLDMFVAPPPDETELMKFEDLNNLKHLQGSIFIPNCKDLDIAVVEKARVLQKKEDIVELLLAFGLFHQSGQQQIEDENALLEALEPHRNLKSLSISEYLGSQVSPKWLNSLINLKNLFLFNCPNCESLPILGTLPSLESLHVSSMEKLEMVGLDFLGIELRDNIYYEAYSKRVISLISSSSSFISFPKLKNLRFYSLHNWKKWESISSSSGKEEDEEICLTIMPCLTLLEIEGCERLEALPDFLQNKPNLNIFWDS